MARVPRRLRHLNLDEEDAVNVQLDEENLHNHEVYDDDANAQVDNVEVNENSLQDPLEIGIPLQSKRPIRIIWPNGVVQQVLGDFRVKHLQQLNGGKVIVETDESGVPNDRSGSILGQHLGDLAESPTFAPLHIKRWSDELFWKHHKAIISDVEEKFIYSSATKQLTRDCILKKVSKAWRSYKSRLKKKYFNREKRTLDAILQDVPKGVNPYQWSALIAIWCEDSHVQALVRKTGKTTVPCTSRKHRINQVDLFEQADNDIVDGCENNHEISYYNLHARPNNMQQSCFVNSTKTKENYANKNLPNERMVSKQAQVESAAKRLKISQSNLESAVPREPNVNHGSQRMVLQQNPSKPDQTEVFLFSLNAITKGKIVAKGNLLRKDRTEVIGGNMLGDEFYGVAVHAVTKYGDEMLPRPYENFRTVRDAIGRLIAWPRSYVKKPKNKTSTRPQVG